MGSLAPLAGMDYLQSQGWTPVAAAGILGNAYGESGFNSDITGDGGAAHGLFQTHTKWHPGYDRNFNGMQQLAFASNELKTKYPDLARQLNSASNVGQSTSLFMHGYEKPANSSSLGKRIASAQSLLEKGNGLVKDGAKLLGIDLGDAAVMAANAYLPGSGEVLKMFGVGGDSCGWLCQLKNWIADSGFFQRIALALLAFIILAAAFYLIKPSVINEAVKGLAA